MGFSANRMQNILHTAEALFVFTVGCVVKAGRAHRPTRTINFGRFNFSIIQRESNLQFDVPIRTSADTETS